jgi:hypothetical protein
MKEIMKFATVMMVAGLTMACSQKQAVVTVPTTQINVEKLLDSIDYNMDISGLSLADVRTLRCAPDAQRGLPFRDSYIRGIYLSTTWYDSLMYEFDEHLPWDKYKIKDDESFYGFYQRMITDADVMKYTEQEKDFIKRLEAREEELRKQNFEVEEGLRVNMQNLTNPHELKDFNQQLFQQLGQDGFAIVPASYNQLFHLYEKNDYQEFPNFVTTDLFLQLYHLYFDCMLRELEESQLLKLMTDFSCDMYNAMNRMEQKAGKDDPIALLARHNAAFFDVAYCLFTGKHIGTPEQTALAKPEIEHAMQAENDFSQFMKDYQKVLFAYSLFRPRGHYSRSESLKSYFRGMMWLQSASFGMDHAEEVKEAVMMAFALKDEPALLRKYERLNKFITFLMGQPDNLSLPQVLAEVEKTGMQMEELLNNEQAIGQIKATLEEIGNKQTRIRPAFERTSHNKICVMPQRYQPDAEVLLKMVDYDSKLTKRATPKGLDFFAAMGISAAEEILMKEKTKWKDFDTHFKQMKERMGEIDWNETIATQWMNALKVMNEQDKDAQLPYFMLNPEWSKKDLNAALASWAELKHDAILYAKQPMGAECGGGGPPEPVVKGYVEPNVRFWKKAIELLDNTYELLKDENLLTEKIEQATTRLKEEAELLLRLSEKELAGQELTDEEYGQIEYIGSTFENISLDLIRQEDQYLSGWDDVEGADRKVALIADVYTANADNNPDKSILFEAVGCGDEIYVVVEMGGYLYLTRGAVLSYREFTQPIDMPRLTDEEWQQQLEGNPRKGVPEWMKRVIVPLEKEPEVNEEYFYSSGC